VFSFQVVSWVNFSSEQSVIKVSRVFHSSESSAVVSVFMVLSRQFLREYQMKTLVLVINGHLYKLFVQSRNARPTTF